MRKSSIFFITHISPSSNHNRFEYIDTNFTKWIPWFILHHNKLLSKIPLKIVKGTNIILFLVFEMKWNLKKANTTFPEAFLKAYPIKETTIITPDNYLEWLL